MVEHAIEITAHLALRWTVRQTDRESDPGTSMSDRDRAELETLQADLERVTRDAKQLMEQLSAALCEQTRLRETHLLDAPPDKTPRRDARRQ